MATWAEYFKSKGIDINSEMTLDDTKGGNEHDNKNIPDSDTLHDEVKGTGREDTLLKSFNDKLDETMTTIQDAFRDLALGGDNEVVKEQTAEEVVDSLITTIRGGKVVGDNTNL